MTTGLKWETLQPGLRRIVHPPGPLFQYHDAAGFEWNTYQVTLPDLPDELEGFRILHLSDLHCQTYWQTAYDDLLDQIKLEKPELILITGDITDDVKRPLTCLPIAKKFLAQLQAPCGVYGIFGNHDRNLTHAAYDGIPIQLLDAQRLIIQARNKPIELIAVPGPQHEDYYPGFEKTLTPKTPGLPQIILSHYPDHFRKLKTLNPDLYLSGHTHGGQVCLPNGTPILRHDSMPMHLLKGVHRLAKSWYFVNRGFGFSTLNFRLFCPSEVIEIRLSRDAR